MRILHIASHKINIGDSLLNSYLRSRIQKHQQSNIEWILHDVHHSEIITSEKIRNFDKVIIGGGGGIDGVSNYETSGMAANVDFKSLAAEDLKKVNIVGLGYNLYFKQKLHTRNALCASFAKILEAGGSISLRNDGSLERFSAQNIDLDILNSISEVADPAFLCAEEKSIPSKLYFPKPYIAINLAADNMIRRLAPTLDKRGMNRLFGRFFNQYFQHKIATRLKYLLNDYNIVFVPHTLRDLYFYGIISKAFYAPKYREKIFLAPIVPPDQYKALFSIYDRAEFTIAMRGHALIYCLARQNPVSVISSHPKIGDMAKEFGVPQLEIGGDTSISLPSMEVPKNDYNYQKIALSIAKLDNQLEYI